MSLRDDTILAQIHGPELPSVAAVVTRFRCGYQQAVRVVEALREREMGFSEADMEAANEEKRLP